MRKYGTLHASCLCVCVHKRCYSAEILYFQTLKSYYQTCMCTVCTTGWITSKATTVCMYMYMCIASFIDCTLGSLSGDLGLWVWLWLLLVPVRVKCWMVCTWKKRWSRFHQLCPHSAWPIFFSFAATCMFWPLMPCTHSNLQLFFLDFITNSCRCGLFSLLLVCFCCLLIWFCCLHCLFC